jgi:phenylpyruvate tautomerase PptA (4-oxalocrotonate tautomerase family)
MPLVTIYASELSADKKKAIASEVTEMMSENYEVPAEMISVYFIPLDSDNAFDAGVPVGAPRSDSGPAGGDAR